jgi:hypothetical protein
MHELNSHYRQLLQLSILGAKIVVGFPILYILATKLKSLKPVTVAMEEVNSIQQIINHPRCTNALVTDEKKAEDNLNEALLRHLEFKGIFGVINLELNGFLKEIETLHISTNLLK